MPDLVFRPYTFAPEALELIVTSLAIDGEPLPGWHDLGDPRATLSLAGQKIARDLAIRVLIKDPNDELPGTLSGGKPADELAVYLKVGVPDSRTRLGIRATAAQQGEWSAEACLSADALAGKVILEAVAVRARSRSPAPGYAVRASEGVADSNKCTIYLDDIPILPGGALAGEWLDFAAPTSPEELRSRADLTWYLDLSKMERPRLLLNDGIKGLKKALEIAQTTGRSARLRDVLIHSILQPVLFELAIEALAAWEPGEEAPTHDWQRGVLEVLGAHCGDASEELKVTQWRERWRKQDRQSVTRDLQTAIQRHLGHSNAASQLVKALEESANA